MAVMLEPVLSSPFNNLSFSLYRPFFLFVSLSSASTFFFLCKAKLYWERERERECVSFFEQQWSFLLQNGFSMFVSFCCFLCSLFMMKLWLHHRSLSLGISLFLCFLRFSLFLCFVLFESELFCFLFSATLCCFF